MVILFKGTDKSKNYAPQALALCAGISATKYYKKTLVLQLTTKYPVEGYVIGKRIADQQINNDMYLFEDSGLDSLTRRAGVTSFTADHFANAVTPVVSSENLYDILEVSRKVETDVEREIVQDPTIVGTIIKSAKKLYDNIFVLANGKSEKVIEAVIPYMDKSVTCISQGLKEDTTAPSCEKNFYLVTNFDYKSAYSLHLMIREYGNKKMNIMPYNVEFKDAYTDKNMLQYILRNTEPEKSDYSYHLITEMTKLCRTLIEDEETENDEYKFSSRTFERYINEPRAVTGDDVDIEVTEKRFLRKSKKIVHFTGEAAEEGINEGEQASKKKKRLQKTEKNAYGMQDEDKVPEPKKKKKRIKKAPDDRTDYFAPTPAYKVTFTPESTELSDIPLEKEAHETLEEISLEALTEALNCETPVETGYMEAGAYAEPEIPADGNTYEYNDNYGAPV